MKILRFGVTAIILSCGFSIQTSAAFADTNYFDGGYSWFYPASTDPGVTSVFCNIYTPKYPAVYSDSGSNAWNMISSSDSGSWAQTGWVKKFDTFSANVYYFYQYMDATMDLPYTVYSAVGPGENTKHAYRTYLDSNGNFVGTEDNVVLASHKAGFQGASSQFSEEIYGYTPYNSAFIGTYGQHGYFDSIRAYYNGSTFNSPVMTWKTDPQAKIDRTLYTVGSTSSSFSCWDDRY